MKWLVGFFVLMGLVVAVLFVPVEGRTLWSRGAGREVAQFVAHELRAGWDAITSLGSEQKRPPRSVHTRRSRKAQTPPARTGPDGIVAQPPKEKLEAQDRAALDRLLQR